MFDASLPMIGKIENLSLPECMLSLYGPQVCAIETCLAKDSLNCPRSPMKSIPFSNLPANLRARPLILTPSLFNSEAIRTCSKGDVGVSVSSTDISKSNFLLPKSFSR